MSHKNSVYREMVCQRQSYLSKNSRDRVLNHEVPSPDSTGKEKSFVEDHVASFDYCHNPSLAWQHGTLIVNERRGSVMTPVISYCKTLHNTDVMGIALDSVNQTLPLMDWKEKTIDKVVWRGSFTDAFHSDDFDWPNSQRERLVKLASTREDRLEGVLMQGWKRVDRKHHPEVCDRIREEFQFAETMTPETALKYKYTVDIDGNGRSSRFHGHSSAHDHEAEKIARRAREFALARWRWQDMQSYMLLMILEYQRMLASDRGALDIMEIHDDVHTQWSRGDM
ncbi:hypothetical protein QFC20_000259 [Naganishia adeliensis]|uniref:Uncharacterized protein n=1 Tax=Naganishia adeliensis TaxID=92952 RepID=A0ACC2X2N6_9TREE|nr:hypothetical protein QFC20_000259 [Naganishia adeliensis]